jgi:hypothetical protein
VFPARLHRSDEGFRAERFLNAGRRPPILAVANVERKETAMVTRIGDTGESMRWAAHIARVHLRMDTLKLTTDVTGGADDRVVADDRVAVLESRGKVGGRLLDVTV